MLETKKQFYKLSERKKECIHKRSGIKMEFEFFRLDWKLENY